MAADLNRFAKISLSSIYPDIMKDILYANAPDAVRPYARVTNEVNDFIPHLRVRIQLVAPSASSPNKR